MKSSNIEMYFQAPENKLFSKSIGVATVVADMRTTLNHFFPREIKNFNRSINKRIQKFFDDLLDEITLRSDEITAWTINSIKTAKPIFKVQRSSYLDSPASSVSIPVSTFSPAPSVSSSDFTPAPVPASSLASYFIPISAPPSSDASFVFLQVYEVQTLLELKNLLNEHFMDSTLNIKIDGMCLRADGGILTICEI